jgi:hypothetical protein
LNQEKEQAKEAAKGWVPPDNVPVRILINGRHAIGVFQFRLEFFNLPDDVQVKPNGTKFVLLRDGQAISLSDLTPQKTLSFVHPTETLPHFPDAIPSRFLACTAMLHDYYARMNAEEEKNMAALGHRYAMPWTNKKGKQEQTCSVLTTSGDVVFSFGTQHLPDKIFFPLDISADGKKAAVMVGEKVSEEGEDARNWVVGKPRAILVWTEGKGLKTIPITDKSLSRMEVLRKYMSGEF